jgi:hypothetical protein
LTLFCCQREKNSGETYLERHFEWIEPLPVVKTFIEKLPKPSTIMENSLALRTCQNATSNQLCELSRRKLMRYPFRLELFLLMSVFFCSLQLSTTLHAAEQQDITGWENGSEYNRLYRVDKYVMLKGTMVEFIDLVPISGMATGAGIVMLLRDGEKVTVHFAPKWFAKFLAYGFSPGDSVKVKGCWAEIGGKKVFMASKVRNGEYFEIKFRRTKDGTPYWTLKPDEIIREKLED